MNALQELMQLQQETNHLISNLKVTPNYTWRENIRKMRTQGQVFLNRRENNAERNMKTKDYLFNYVLR